MDLKNRKNLQRRATCALLLLLSAGVTAQDIPVTSTGALRFHVDRAGFLDASGAAYQELYLMLYADQLRYDRTNEGPQGAMQVTAVASNPGGDEVFRKTWTTEISVTEDTSDFRSMAVYDQWVMQLAPAEYLLHVEVVDLNSNDKGEARWALRVPEVGSERVRASDIEFVAAAQTGVTQPPFAKGNRTIIPNPDRRYGLLKPQMYFYLELYGLPSFPGNMMQMIYSVRARDGSVVKTYPAFRMRQPGSTASILHGLDVSKLASGIYTLTAQLQDTTGGAQLSVSRDFEVIQADYLGGPPALTDAQTLYAARLLKHCASTAEYESFQALGASGKARFLIRFWRDNDPTPGTLENEYLAQMQQRFEYAKEHFRWGEVEGDATDRGRVLMKYGMPDEIERRYSEAETVPHEIWVYRQPRLDIFVFGDLRADGRFALLHCTKENEVHNDGWIALIRKM